MGILGITKGIASGTGKVAVTGAKGIFAGGIFAGLIALIISLSPLWVPLLIIYLIYNAFSEEYQHKKENRY